MEENEKDIVVPVLSEELHADAVPVVTGGVRVTKRVQMHQEILEQELRKSHAEVKRVKTNRVVDGPQPVQRVGNTLVIPVVSEVLHIEKQWVVTEEIHITQIEQTETVQQTVPVRREEAEIERLNESGDPVAAVEAPAPVATDPAPTRRLGPASILEATTREPDTRTADAGSKTGRTPRGLLSKKISSSSS